MKRILSTCFGITAFLSLSAECSVFEIPLNERVSNSTVVVEGEVISQSSFWNSTHTMIYTATTVDLYKIFKGNPANQIEIITEGGTVGMDMITVEPSLQLHVGEVGMFTCIPVTRAKGLPANVSGRPRYEAYASVQGFVKYNLATNTASDPFRVYHGIQTNVYNVVAPAGGHQFREVRTLERGNHSTQRSGGPSVQAGPVINTVTPANVTAGTGSVITIDGLNFGTTQGSSVIKFLNADDAGATYITPLPTQYVSWSDTQIRVEVPTKAGTGKPVWDDNLGTTAESPSILTVDYAHLNVTFDPGTGDEAYQTDHVNDDGSGGYTWQMNNSFAANGAATTAFLSAFDSWRCSSGVYWALGANTANDQAQADGVNVITFDNADPLGAGILGVCFSYWSGCASGPNIVWYVNELDIIFDEGSNIAPLTWQFGPGLPTINQYDFETVAVHELGHGHQLGHVINSGAIMHYAINNGADNRALDPSDIAGSDFVQSKSIISNLCGPGAMSSFVCGGAPVAAFESDDQNVCEGQTVNFTDLSTGGPNQWQWTFTGAIPSGSTLQNPSVFYPTAGVYDVTLVASNASGSDSETMTGYITVSGNPTVGFTANPSNLTVCAGGQVTLSGTGAVSYNWSGGITDGVPFTPGVSGDYTVTGTNAAGCIDTDVASVVVNANPTLNITSNPANGIVCTGNQATLTATGAQSYSWTGGITNGVPFTPPSTTTYTVTGTGSNGCTSTSTRTITVQSCSGPTTTVPCGITITNKGQSRSAVNVPGAIQYRFKFYDNSTLALVGQVTQASRTLTFNMVPGIYYGNIYRWTVAVNTGSGFGAESSINCTVTLATPQTTLPCGYSYSKLNGYSAVPSIYSSAGYRYSFYDNTTSALISQVTQTSNYIYFNQVPNLQFGTTYKWTVEVQYNNGTGLVFGPASPMSCLVTMVAPRTTVPCNNTYNKQGGYSAAAAVSGATGYRFTFYQSSVQVAQVATTSPYIYFSQINGIWNGNTYQWTVEVQYNNGTGLVYGTASAACNITFSSSARLGDPYDPNVQPPAEELTSFAILMYPNPVGDGVNPSLNITGADQQEANVSIIDLSGRVITTYTLFVEGDNYVAELSNFPELPSGFYLLQVQVGETVQTQKFVAE